MLSLFCCTAGLETNFHIAQTFQETERIHLIFKIKPYMWTSSPVELMALTCYALWMCSVGFKVDRQNTDVLLTLHAKSASSSWQHCCSIHKYWVDLFRRDLLKECTPTRTTLVTGDISFVDSVQMEFSISVDVLPLMAFKPLPGLMDSPLQQLFIPDSLLPPLELDASRTQFHTSLSCSVFTFWGCLYHFLSIWIQIKSIHYPWLLWYFSQFTLVVHWCHFYKSADKVPVESLNVSTFVENLWIFIKKIPPWAPPRHPLCISLSTVKGIR